MNADGHPLDLILAYEELDAGPRAAADAHLAACEPCRALLARLQAAEATLPAGVDLDDPLADLPPETRAAADASRSALLARVARKRRSLVPWPRGGGLGFVLPLAAVLVVITGIAVFERNAADPFDALRLAPAVVTRDAPAELQPGSAVSIRFTADRDGWPVVVQADASGVRLLCPTPDLAGWPVRAGLPVVLPPPGTGVTWALGEDAPAERWWIALSADPVSDPAALAALLTADGPDRVTALLQGRFGAAAEIPRR
jgi:hypothetical protein